MKQVTCNMNLVQKAVTLKTAKQFAISLRALVWVFALVAASFLPTPVCAQEGAPQPPASQAGFNPPSAKQLVETGEQTGASQQPLLTQLQTGTTALAFTNFDNAGNLSLAGSARALFGRLRLTPAQTWQSGAAFSLDKQPVGRGFETTFQFQLTNLDYYYSGADGFAFVIHNSGPWAWYPRPGTIGYQGLFNSLVVEFDTYNNGNEPNANHISIHTRGTGANEEGEGASIGRTTAIPYLKDGRVHTVKITYRPGIPDTWTPWGKLHIFIDDFSAPVLETYIDLHELLYLDGGERAYVGFVAGTGAGFENHDLLSWSFSGGSPCTNCMAYNGMLSGTGNREFQPNGSYYYSAAWGTHTGWLRGAAGADFDLYLQRWNGFRWETVAASESSTPNEQLSYYGAPGYYSWLIYSFEGSGRYQFWMQRP